MAKLTNGSPVDLTTLSQLEAKVGSVVKSLLDYTAFSNEHLGTWYPMDGRSCVGTTYQTLSGNAIVPDALTTGAFLRQAKAGRTVGTFEADDVIAHTHQLPFYQDSGGGIAGRGNPVHGGASTNQRLDYIQSTGGTETRPKNVAVNYYIKVIY